MTITKEQFEHEVPAFRTPEPEGESTVWEALQVHLGEAVRHVCAHYGVNLTQPAAPEAAPGLSDISDDGEETAAPEGEPTPGEPVGSEDETPADGSEPGGDEDEPGGDEGEPAPVDLPIEGDALHLVCVRAARHAMAGADLVLTATGFGVVSNQNLAPASTVRVQALAEELRRDESRTADHLAFRLLKDSAWPRGEAARRIVSRLMWCPMLLRRHGVATPPGSGREPYDEEYRALIPRIDQAEARLAELISPELYAALVDSRRVRPAREAEALALDLVTETARNLVAAHLAQPAAAPTPAQATLTRRLLRLVRSLAADLPAWQQSATRRAQEAPRYENRKSDPCFFF